MSDEINITSDVTITVSDNPVQISVIETPIEINVGIVGIQGPGDSSNNSVNLGNIVTGVSISGGISITGAVNIIPGSNVVLNQIGLNTFSISADTGNSSNLFGLATTGFVTGVSGSLNERINAIAGANLQGLISTGSADDRYYPLHSNPSGYITGFNSGLYITTGQTGQFYPISNPAQYIKSGDANNTFYLLTNPNNYIQSGNVTGIYVLKTDTGSFITNSNLIGLLTTGAGDLRYLQSGSSGLFYLASNPSNYITSINLVGLGTTGSFDLRYLQTGVSGEFLKSFNLNGLISTGDVNVISGALSSRLEATGGYLFSLINASSAGVSSVNGASGILIINGTGNVSITTVGQIITVSGNTGFLAGYYINSNPLNFSSSGNVETSGTSLQNQINLERNFPRITGIQISGSGISLTGAIILTGVGNVSVQNSGIFIYISGNTGEYVNFYKTSNPNNFAQSGQFISGVSISGGLAFQGALNINAGSNISLNQQGNNTFQISTSIPGGFLSSGDANLLYLKSGNNQVVYTTGGQTIDGQKIFNTNVYFYRTGLFDDNTAAQGNKQFNEVVKIGRYYDTESNNVVGFDVAPSHGIGFHRNWAGTTTGKLAGIFAYPGQNWAGGLLFQTNDTAVGPEGPMKTVMILQGDGKVKIATGGIAAENLHVDGFIRSDLGFKSGIFNLADILYPRSNPNNFVRSGEFISGVSVTGGIGIQGVLNINAGSNISLTQQGTNTFSISSTASAGSSYAGVTGLSITGGISISGEIGIKAGENISLIQSGLNNFFIQANIPPGLASTGYVNSASGSLSERLSTTGSTLLALINASSAGVSSLNALSGALNLVGTAGISVTSSAQTITISGINELRIRTSLTTGIETLFVEFSPVFPSNPMIMPSLEVSGEICYFINFTGVSTSGYYPIFSDILRETGIYLNTLAKIF